MRKHDHGQALALLHSGGENVKKLVKQYKKSAKNSGFSKFEMPEFDTGLQEFNANSIETVNIKSLSTGSSENLGRSLEDEDESVDYEEEEEEDEELEEEEEDDYEVYKEEKVNEASFEEELGMDQIYAKNGLGKGEEASNAVCS